MKTKENFYYFDKSNYTKMPYEEIEKVDIMLDNGRVIRIYAEEVKDFSLELYDRLIVFDGDIVPVVKSGKLFFEYEDIRAVASGNRRGFDAAQYLLKEANVSNVELTIDDEIYTFFGEIKADITENECTIDFLPNDKYGESKGNMLKIELDDILQDNIGDVMLKFLNDDAIFLYEYNFDIIDLQFDSLLTLNGGALTRCIKSGKIIMDLDEDNPAKYYINDEDLENTIENVERRICGRGNVSTHDITSVILEYADYRVKTFVGEEVVVKGNYTHQEEDSIYGYTVRAVSDRIIITFGKDSLSLLEETSLDESTWYYDDSYDDDEEDDDDADYYDD